MFFGSIEPVPVSEEPPPQMSHEKYSFPMESFILLSLKPMGRDWWHQSETKIKEFTKMNFSNIPDVSHISLSAFASPAIAYNLLAYSCFWDSFLLVSTFLSTLTPLSPILCSLISWRGSSCKTSITFTRSGARPAPHSTAPPRLLPRHLVWLLQPTSQKVPTTKHHLLPGQVDHSRIFEFTARTWKVSDVLLNSRFGLED